MHTSPHCTMVDPISDAKNAPLPSEPWLRITAGNGPGPGGLRSTPARSYVTPSTVPRNVQVAPTEVSGFPTILKLDVSGAVDGFVPPPQPRALKTTSIVAATW